MSGVLERERTRIPVRRRSPVLDYTLIVLGALVALVGLYFQFAPSDWWLAHFSEAYQYGCYTLGGLMLGAGFGVFADRMSRARIIAIGFVPWSAGMLLQSVAASFAVLVFARRSRVGVGKSDFGYSPFIE